MASLALACQRLTHVTTWCSLLEGLSQCNIHGAGKLQSHASLCGMYGSHASYDQEGTQFKAGKDLSVPDTVLDQLHADLATTLSHPTVM